MDFAQASERIIQHQFTVLGVITEWSTGPFGLKFWLERVWVLLIEIVVKVRLTYSSFDAMSLHFLRMLKNPLAEARGCTAFWTLKVKSQLKNLCELMVSWGSCVEMSRPNTAWRVGWLVGWCKAFIKSNPSLVEFWLCLGCDNSTFSVCS